MWFQHDRNGCSREQCDTVMRSHRMRRRDEVCVRLVDRTKKN